MLKTKQFTEARSQLSQLFDEVVEKLSPVLIRRRNREALLVRREELEALLEPFILRPQVIREDDGTITLAVDELEWAVNAPSEEEAFRELIIDLRQYAEDYFARAQLFLNAPNRRTHFPYVLRILLAQDDNKIRKMLLA